MWFVFLAVEDPERARMGGHELPIYIVQLVACLPAPRVTFLL